MNTFTSTALREVRDRDWPALCERLNQLQGAIATIEFVDLNGSKREVARNAEFEGASFGKLDACNNRILIRVRDNRVVEHGVIDPLHLKLEETEDGRDFDAVFMEGEKGTTVLRIHPAIHASQVAGIELR